MVTKPSKDFSATTKMTKKPTCNCFSADGWRILRSGDLIEVRDEVKHQFSENFRQIGSDEVYAGYASHGQPNKRNEHYVKVMQIGEVKQ